MALRLTLCFLFFSLITHAQVTIYGRVTDANGNALPGANISLRDTYDGTSADANGGFTFTSTEKGSHTLTISAISYATSEIEIQLISDRLEVNVALEGVITELNAVVITAGSFTAGDESRRTTFKSLDIATTAGATADIAGALNTLPGTQKVGETGRLFVRGGDDNESRTFIDGLVVFDAYSPSAPNTPTRGRFLPFMFKGTSFSTGGYSAEFGQALSSALALDSKDEDLITRTDIGLLSVGADIAHTQAWKDGSAAAKVQYTNLRPYMGLVNQEIDWINPPLSFEVSGALRQRFGDKGLLKFYGNSNESNLALYEHEILEPANRHALDITNRYRYGNLSYQGVLGKEWSIRSGIAYNTSDYATTMEGSSLTEKGNGLHLKSVVERNTGFGSFKVGTEWIDRKYRANWYSEQQGSLIQQFHEPILAVFAEVDLLASKNFVARGGIRGEYNGLTSNAALDPRLSLAQKVGAGQVSIAYGTFRQSPQTPWLRANPQLKAEKAEHWVLNYQQILDNRTFRIEIYHKRYTNLVKFQMPSWIPPQGFAPLLTSLTNDGHGWAQGVEVFWRDKKSVRNLDYWVSYSYLDTERNYLYFPQAAVPTFASTHNLSIVFKYFIPSLKTQVGATYSYASGRTFHNPNEPGFLQGRTPAYQDLSINFSYLPTNAVIIHLSCTNILGFDNIFGYNYSVTTDADGMYANRPIRQAAPRFLFLAVLITISKNKGMNQLPSL